MLHSYIYNYLLAEVTEIHILDHERPALRQIVLGYEHEHTALGHIVTHVGFDRLLEFFVDPLRLGTAQTQKRRKLVKALAIVLRFSIHLLFAHVQRHLHLVLVERILVDARLRVDESRPLHIDDLGERGALRVLDDREWAARHLRHDSRKQICFCKRIMDIHNKAINLVP